MNEPRKTVLTLLVLLAIGLIMLGAEWLLETVARRWLALVGLGLAVLVILLGVHFAVAQS